jgi:exonuclease III
MLYQNVRSLKSTYWDSSSNTKESKLSCFHDVVMANQFDIIALTETWLDSWILNHELLPIGYDIFRRDREGKRGGGVLLAIKEPIKTDQFNCASQSLEIVSVVVNSMSKNVLVCVCYRPPNAGIEFHQEFERFLKFANESRYKEIIVLGDFNFPSIHWLNGSGFSDATIESRFTDYLQESRLFQLINVPTRGHNLIDLLLTTNEYFVHNITVTDDDLFV